MPTQVRAAGEASLAAASALPGVASRLAHLARRRARASRARQAVVAASSRGVGHGAVWALGTRELGGSRLV